MKPSVALTLLVVGLFSSAQAIRASAFVLNPDGTFVTITILGGGVLYGINDSGQLVGDSNSSGPFVYSAGVFTTINVPGGPAQASGINNHGQVSGWYETINPIGTHGFIDSNGDLMTIDVPGHNDNPGTLAYSINNAGQVTGWFTNDTGEHVFIDTNGVFTTFDVAGEPGQLNVGIGINDSGQVVGAFGRSSDSFRHGFLYSGGVLKTIDVPGATYTQPWGINDSGQIVGFYFDATGVEHGFLYVDGVFTTIDAPGATGTQLFGINDQGQIVGSSSFFATPEPASLLLLASGLAALAILIVRSRITGTSSY